MNKKKKKGYSVIKKHYLIPLTLCGLIVISGIIMTLTNQIGNGHTIVNRHKVYAEITGPQAIVLGSVFIAGICYHIRILYK